MSNHSAIGKRMKENYEDRAKTYLTRRTPVIIRIDGKSFHTFTKGFERPFDNLLINCMEETAKHLCYDIMGVKIAYHQSDEISFLLTDYDKLTTESWFDYSVQKVCSVSASLATMYFNEIFFEGVKKLSDDNPNKKKYLSRLFKASFDSRCFNIPESEVCNYFIWRQQDATRNSIEMLGRSYFSDKELHKKNTSQIQDMLMEQYKVNWNDLIPKYKRGSAIFKLEEGNMETVLGINHLVTRTKWIVDENTPIFSKDRDYIEKWIGIADTE